LREKGYGLLVFDAYRPWSVTRLFWEETPPSKRAFVANPRQGSKHNRGTAVDLTLYDLATGREAAMPSAYDEFTARAHPRYAGGPPGARARRDLLRAALEREGFTVEPNEWWHFNWRDWRSYRLLDVPLRTRPGR
jgi:D-alanyl-D-alanine dipeptidase